jgi:hypothetical protein
MAAMAPRALDGLQRLLLGGLGHEQRELVAAQAGQDVLGAGDVAQRAGDGGEHRVAALVAERVVDRLEVVDVEQRQRERALVAQRARELLAQRGDAPRGQHEDVRRRRAGGHGGGQLAHYCVLFGDARKEHAAGHDHGGQRREDEHGAERVRRDALRPGMRVVEQRQLVGDDGADHAEGGEPARQEAGGVDDHEDGDVSTGESEPPVA